MRNQFAKMSSVLTTCALAFNFSVSTCFAHPDHPVQVAPSDSLLHYFVQPEHALPIAILAAAMWWVCRLVKPASLVRIPAKKIVQNEDRG